MNSKKRDICDISGNEPINNVDRDIPKKIGKNCCSSSDTIHFSLEPIKDPEEHVPTKIGDNDPIKAIKKALVKRYKEKRYPSNQDKILKALLRSRMELRKITPNIKTCDPEILKKASQDEFKKIMDNTMLLDLIDRALEFRPTDMGIPDIDYTYSVYKMILEYHPDLISIEEAQVNGAINSISIIGPLKKEVWSKL